MDRGRWGHKKGVTETFTRLLRGGLADLAQSWQRVRDVRQGRSVQLAVARHCVACRRQCYSWVSTPISAFKPRKPRRNSGFMRLQRGARTDLLLLHSSRELVDRGGVSGFLRTGLVLVVVSCGDLLGLHPSIRACQCWSDVGPADEKP